MCRYKFHPPHLITVAALPCETQNSENVILYTVGYYQRKLRQLWYMFNRSQHVDYKIWGIMQQCVYKTKICDICDMQKRLTQTWVDSEQNAIEAAIDQLHERLRSCVRAGGGHFDNLYSPEYKNQ